MNLNNKLPLPKLNFNQDKSENKENNIEKKLPDDKKFKLVYLDDEYARVETIKLKPKGTTTTPMQSYATPTNRKSAFENTHSRLEFCLQHKTLSYA